MANNLFSKAEILALKDSIVGDVLNYTNLIQQNKKDISSLKGDIADCVNGLSHKTKSIHIEWELGYITIAGVEGTSITSARTKNILHISKGDIARYSSEGYKSLNVFFVQF